MNPKLWSLLRYTSNASTLKVCLIETSSIKHFLVASPQDWPEQKQQFIVGGVLFARIRQHFLLSLWVTHGAPRQSFCSSLFRQRFSHEQSWNAKVLLASFSLVHWRSRPHSQTSFLCARSNWYLKAEWPANPNSVTGFKAVPCAVKINSLIHMLPQHMVPNCTIFHSGKVNPKQNHSTFFQDTKIQVHPDVQHKIRGLTLHWCHVANQRGCWRSTSTGGRLQGNGVPLSLMGGWWWCCRGYRLQRLGGSA